MSDKTRAEFEAYLLSKYQKPEMGGDWSVWKDDAGNYIYMQSEWEAWLASRKSALEAAAQATRDMIERWDGPYRRSGDLIADALSACAAAEARQGGETP